MVSFASTMLITSLLSMVTLVNQERAQTDNFGERLLHCAKVCSECQMTCETCFTHCLALTGEAQKEHAKTAKLCLDCAECCKSCATLCARESVLSRFMLECCEQSCKLCAEACEKHENDKHMDACAKSCRECQKECAEMLKQMGGQHKSSEKKAD